MLKRIPRSRIEPPSAAVALTVRGTITTSGHSIGHTQYLTDHYVVTEVGRSLILHSGTLGGRFVVDRGERRLRPVNPETQRVQIEHLRELVGTVSVHRFKELVDIDGFLCRRYRLCNDGHRIVIAADAYCTQVEAAARTALHQERAIEAELHPLCLPLDPHEVVVRSTTRTFANGFQHTQCYRLRSILPSIPNRAVLDEIMSYRILDE